MRSSPHDAKAATLCNTLAQHVFFCVPCCQAVPMRAYVGGPCRSHRASLSSFFVCLQRIGQESVCRAPASVEVFSAAPVPVAVLTDLFHQVFAWLHKPHSQLATDEAARDDTFVSLTMQPESDVGTILEHRVLSCQYGRTC